MGADVLIEAYAGPVNHGQEIAVPLCDWIVGFELTTDNPWLHFAMIDVNGQIMAQLPHVATLPKPDPVTGSVEYYCGPYLNRSGACPVILRAFTEDGSKPSQLRLIVKGVTER